MRIIVRFCDLKTRYSCSLANSCFKLNDRALQSHAKYYGVCSVSALKRLIQRDYDEQWRITREPCHLWSTHLHEPLCVWSPWTLVRLCTMSPKYILLVFREYRFINFIEGVSERLNVISNIKGGMKRQVEARIFPTKQKRLSIEVTNKRHRRRRIHDVMKQSSRGLLRAFVAFHVHNNCLWLHVKRLQFST